MGIFSGITDHFKNSEFSVSGRKKLGTISKEFTKAFGLTLLIYKGNQRADSKLSFADLNKKTSLKVDTSINNADISLKASMSIDEVERIFLDTYGVKVQVGDKKGDIMSSKLGKITLGEASRGEFE
tara:strand:+ start:508 stop:885 length:378 start_codon:yes stop_codon:yes gene_type:complete